MPDFALERQLAKRHGPPIAGIDEAGRGPWAGPVVAAAVILDPGRVPAALLERLDDSKKVPKARRERLFEEISRLAGCEAPAGLGIRLGIGVASVEEIDRLNILGATLGAMARAVGRLGQVPGAALVDGNRAPLLPCPVETVVKGDGRSLSIAAASIIAKVSRDRLMADLARRHPGYGWERNQGYGTPEHRAALRRLGVTPAHRRSFRPVHEALAITP